MMNSSGGRKENGRSQEKPRMSSPMKMEVLPLKVCSPVKEKLLERDRIQYELVVHKPEYYGLIR